MIHIAAICKWPGRQLWKSLPYVDIQKIVIHKNELIKKRESLSFLFNINVTHNVILVSEVLFQIWIFGDLRIWYRKQRSALSVSMRTMIKP